MSRQLSFEDGALIVRLEAAIGRLLANPAYRQNQVLTVDQSVANLRRKIELVKAGDYQVVPVDVMPAIRAFGEEVCKVVKFTHMREGNHFVRTRYQRRANC